MNKNLIISISLFGIIFIISCVVVIIHMSKKESTDDNNNNQNNNNNNNSDQILDIKEEDIDCVFFKSPCDVETCKQEYKILTDSSGNGNKCDYANNSKIDCENTNDCIYTCKKPKDIEGYVIDKINDITFGSVDLEVTCAEGYNGIPEYVECSEPGEDVIFSGCEKNKCTIPVIEGYNISYTVESEDGNGDYISHISKFAIIR